MDSRKTDSCCGPKSSSWWKKPLLIAVLAGIAVGLSLLFR